MGQQVQFNYSTIGRKPGQYYQGLPFKDASNVLIIIDKSGDKIVRPEIVVVGLYKAGTFNKLGIDGLPVTHMTVIPDKDPAAEITDLITREFAHIGVQQVRFM